MSKRTEVTRSKRSKSATRMAGEIRKRFRVPAGGGRATDPRWNDKRLIPIAPRTLDRLQRIAKYMHDQTGLRVDPMQLGAIFLETAVNDFDLQRR